jgi:hypothetical protein
VELYQALIADDSESELPAYSWSSGKISFPSTFSFEDVADLRTDGQQVPITIPRCD